MTDAAPAASGTGTRRRIKQLEVMVSEVVRETADTTTLKLFTGNEALNYRPGHFLTIDPHQFASLGRWVQYLEDVKGRKETARAYSIASSPHEKRLAITVKEERYRSGHTAFPPLLSPLLVRRTPPGTSMVITGFTGPYALPEDIEARSSRLLHLCAGSGIVPNRSTLKYSLEHHPGLSHTLIYGNKTWDDIIYREELAALQHAFPERLRVIHALSREPDAARRGPDVRVGRVDRALIEEFLGDSASVDVFSCGPAISRFDKLRAQEAGEEPAPRFQETVLAALDALGVPKQRVHKESFG
ncbi:MAG: hypothetical protein DHS20C15_05430 [Planctomycetota bacterium]|nr:MAG: hypothetical protein DHS20C15_05430 [Planctomycetota bacterium]